MAQEAVKTAEAPAPEAPNQLDAVFARLNKLEAEAAEKDAKIAVLEESVTKTAVEAPAEKTGKKAAKPLPVLTGEIWTHGKQKYRMLYPAFVLDDKNYTEADVLANPELRKKLVDGEYGVFEAVN